MSPKEEKIDIQGAYVSCFISVNSLREAERKAIDLIIENDWQPIMFLRWRILCSERYPDPYDPDFKEIKSYMKEALLCGCSLVFYQWSEECEVESTNEFWEINFSYFKLLKLPSLKR